MLVNLLCFILSSSYLIEFYKNAGVWARTLVTSHINLSNKQINWFMNQVTKTGIHQKEKVT